MKRETYCHGRLKKRREPSGTGCALLSAGGRARGGGGEIGQLGERDALPWRRRRRRKRRGLLATKGQLEGGRWRDEGREVEGGREDGGGRGGRGERGGVKHRR